MADITLKFSGKLYRDMRIVSEGKTFAGEDFSTENLPAHQRNVIEMVMCGDLEIIVHEDGTRQVNMVNY